MKLTPVYFIAFVLAGTLLSMSSICQTLGTPEENRAYSLPDREVAWLKQKVVSLLEWEYFWGDLSEEEKNRRHQKSRQGVRIKFLIREDAQISIIIPEIYYDRTFKKTKGVHKPVDRVVSALEPFKEEHLIKVLSEGRKFSLKEDTLTLPDFSKERRLGPLDSNQKRIIQQIKSDLAYQIASDPDDRDFSGPEKRRIVISNFNLDAPRILVYWGYGNILFELTLIEKFRSYGVYFGIFETEISRRSGDEREALEEKVKKIERHGLVEQVPLQRILQVRKSLKEMERTVKPRVRKVQRKQ